MKAKRIDLIKEYILENEHVSLKELEDTFNVSMNTIRRDIAQLLEDPRFEKVYGGISVKKNQLISFENRNTENQEVKQAIAETAAQFIQNGDLIYIDSGTTTKYILDYLDKDIQITIITNSLDVILRAEKFKIFLYLFLVTFSKRRLVPLWDFLLNR
jgi:DeoR family myo-inositol catabolism operon transcriptional repressor